MRGDRKVAGWFAEVPPAVRLAEPGDLAAVARLVEAGFARHIAPGYDAVGRVAFRMYAAERALAERLAGGTLALVAERDGTVLGYAEVQGRGRVLTGRDHLSLLFVALQQQRRGIGRLLLDDIRCRLAALPDPPADLTVHSAPNAVGAYARYGFVATGPESQAGGVRHVPMRLDLRRSAGEAADQRAGEPAEADQGADDDGQRRHVADA
ncbi:MAG: GNAT family N-acetyltransferase [Geminicoccaceae bacterium]